MESLKAIPTEYRSVRYRSKSEAMFARWLDLNGTSLAIGYGGSIMASGFDYEPHGLVIDDTFNAGAAWFVDFLHWCVVSNVNEISTFVPLMHYSIIEYKPSKPTKTYLVSLGRKFDVIKQQFPFLFSSSYFCFYGSVFNKSRDLLRYESGSWVSVGIDWSDGLEGEILSTRFDLEGASCLA